MRWIGNLCLVCCCLNLQNDWVISRVFNKSSGAKKPNFDELVRLEELQPSLLPPLMDSSPYNNSETKAMSMTPNSSHDVTCFSNPYVVENQLKATTTKQEELGMFGTTPCSSPLLLSSKPSFSNMLSEQDSSNFKFDDSLFSQDQSMLKLLLEGKGSNSNSISNHEIINNLTGPFDQQDFFWDY